MTDTPLQAPPRTLRETIDSDVLMRLIGEPPARSVQAAFDISERHARRLHKAGHIPALLLGNRLMVPTAFVRRVLDGEIVIPRLGDEDDQA